MGTVGEKHGISEALQEVPCGRKHVIQEEQSRRWGQGEAEARKCSASKNSLSERFCFHILTDVMKRYSCILVASDIFLFFYSFSDFFSLLSGC